MDCFKILHLPTARYIKYDLENNEEVAFYSYEKALRFLHSVVRPEDRCRYSVVSVELDKDVINSTIIL